MDKPIYLTENKKKTELRFLNRKGFKRSNNIKI